MNQQSGTSVPHAKFNNLWHLTRGERGRYACAVLAMALTNLCMFGAPLIGGQAIDLIQSSGDQPGSSVLVRSLEWFIQAPSQTQVLWWAAAISILITALGGVFLYARGRLAALASERIARRLREALYARLHRIQTSFYDSADTGDLVQRCSSDVETLRVFLVSDVIEIGRAIMLVICLIPILFAIHTTLAWLSLVLMPFLALGAFIFFNKVKSAFQETDESEAAMTATLQENLTGIRVVRAFARQDHEIAKFAQRNADFRDKNNHLIWLMGYYWSISDFFAMSQMGIVLLAGGYFALQSAITIGDLFVFMTCEAIVIWPVRQLGRVLTDSGKAVIALERVNHILGQTPEAQGIVPSSGRCKGAITVQDLDLSYAQQPILNQLSITIPAGETLGIVGPPGSGKSTFIRALLGLYPYHSGSIRIDAEEVADLDPTWLRAQIGVVLQDPFLYSRSIWDNITIGRPEASESRVTAACDEAALTNAINTFPQGYDAMVGERGVTLSGGQRQRLALARALLKDPPILILDDSLSAVDTGTEALILDALRKRQGSATTLIVAHRLSSVIHADRIMVLNEGRCVQLGTHQQLSQQPGIYQRLCAIQGTLDAEIGAELRELNSAEITEHVR